MLVISTMTFRPSTRKSPLCRPFFKIRVDGRLIKTIGKKSCFLKYPADTRAAINTPRARHLFHVTAHNQSMDLSV